MADDRSAEEKNKEHIKPLTEAELQDFNQRYAEGRLIVSKRPPWTCGDCGQKAVRNFRYIGDIDPTAEWENSCENCGHVTTS